MDNQEFMRSLTYQVLPLIPSPGTVNPEWFVKRENRTKFSPLRYTLAVDAEGFAAKEIVVNVRPYKEKSGHGRRYDTWGFDADIKAGAFEYSGSLKGRGWFHVFLLLGMYWALPKEIRDQHWPSERNGVKSEWIPLAIRTVDEISEVAKAAGMVFEYRDWDNFFEGHFSRPEDKDLMSYEKITVTFHFGEAGWRAHTPSLRIQLGESYMVRSGEKPVYRAIQRKDGTFNVDLIVKQAKERLDWKVADEARRKQYSDDFQTTKAVMEAVQEKYHPEYTYYLKPDGRNVRVDGLTFPVEEYDRFMQVMIEAGFIEQKKPEAQEAEA